MSSHPVSISSRYVESFRGQLDSGTQFQHSLRGFREALNIVAFHATQKKNTAEECLLSTLETTGATRGRSSESLAQANAVVQEQEATVLHWSTIGSRVQSLLRELDEHAGGFTESFKAEMLTITYEVKSAPWGHPVDDPWQCIPSVTADLNGILERASEVPPLSVDRQSYVLTEAQTLQLAVAPAARQYGRLGSPTGSSTSGFAATVAPLATQSQSSSGLLATTASPTADKETPPLSPPVTAAAKPSTTSGKLSATTSSAASPVGSFRLKDTKVCPVRVSCLTYDTEVADLSPIETIVLGTETGDIFSLPMTVLGGESLMPSKMLSDGKDPNRSGAASPSKGKAKNAQKKKKELALAVEKNQPNSIGIAPTQVNPALEQYVTAMGGKIYTGHTYPIVHLRVILHKETKYIISSGLDKAVRMSHMPSRQLRLLLTDTRGVIVQTTYLKKSGRLVTGSFDGTVSLWDLGSGERLFPPVAKLPSPVHSLVCGGSGGTLSGGSLPLPHTVGVNDGTPFGEVVACGTRNGHVYIFAPSAADKPSTTLTLTTKAPAYICIAAFLPPGMNPLVPMRVNPNSLDASEVQEEAPRSGTPPPPVGNASSASPNKLEQQSIGHKGAVTAIVFPAPTVLFTGDENGEVILSALAYPSASQIVTASTSEVDQPGPRLQQLRRFHHHVDAITSMSVSYDGLLIVASQDATISCLAWRDGVLLQRLTRHYHKVSGCVMGPTVKRNVDISQLLSQGGDSSKKMKKDGEDSWPGFVSLKSLPGALQCSIVTSALDGEIVLWDVGVNS